MIEPSHPQYRPVWQMLQEVWERYRRPLFKPARALKATRGRRGCGMSDTKCGARCVKG